MQVIRKGKTNSVNNVNSEELKVKTIGCSEFDLCLKIDNSGERKIRSTHTQWPCLDAFYSQENNSS